MTVDCHVVPFSIVGTGPVHIDKQPQPMPQQAKANIAPRGANGLRRITQAKLTVGDVKDPAEREADDIADLVLSFARSPSVQTSEGGRIRRSTTGDSAPAAVRRVVPSGREGGRIQRGTTSDSAPTARRRLGPSETDGGRIQRSTASGSAPVAVHHRFPIGREGGDLDPDTERELQSARTGGTALDAGVQRHFGQAMGADVSAVRLHAGQQATSLNNQMGAKAFTLGNDIFFSDGIPDTGSDAGLGLVAHEVAHTVQQGASPVSRAVQRKAEDESGESEGTEGAAPDVLQGVGEDVDAEDVEKGGLQRAGAPEGVMEDRAGFAGISGPTRARGRAAPSGASDVRVSSSVGSSISINKSASPLASSQVSDSVTASTQAAFAMGGPNATMESKTALGEMDPKMKLSNITWKLNTTKAGRTAAISCTIDASADWCLNSRGKIDVPSGTDGVVTADNYAQIAADLTVAQRDKCWVPPRKKYWVQHLTERHEKVHATDFGNFITGGAKSFVKDYLDKQTIDIRDEEAKDTESWFSWWSVPAKASVQKKVDDLMRDTQRALNGAYSLYMFGPTGTTYHNQPTEEKAFGDGKQPYENMVAAVTAQGEKLSAAKSQATTPVEPEPSTVDK